MYLDIIISPVTYGLHIVFKKHELLMRFELVMRSDEHYCEPKFKITNLFLSDLNYFQAKNTVTC